ncbi:MAG TPA: ATP-binding cassette domain-containing protein [Trebonia sp.]|nr:ATP-binding cassette domain-containing protein [Trebonia sp.]
MVIVVAVLVVGGLIWLLQRNRHAGRGLGPPPAGAVTNPGLPSATYDGEPVAASRRPLGRIEVRGLTKEYSGVAVVDDVCFTAEPGRVTGFLGPNGAGKTTTLRMLLGLVAPSAGVAEIGGFRYARIEEPICLVGAVLEASGADEGRTGRDHLRVLCQAAGLPRSRADEVLTAVGLARVGRRRVRAYSLGMRQRLGLAAALLGDPQVLILDEPGNGLDPAGIRWIRTFLRSLAATGRTVLVSSHQLGEIEQMADDLVVIAAGRVVAAGPLASVVGGHAGLEEAFLELTAGTEGIR